MLITLGKCLHYGATDTVQRWSSEQAPDIYSNFSDSNVVGNIVVYLVPYVCIVDLKVD